MVNMRHLGFKPRTGDEVGSVRGGSDAIVVRVKECPLTLSYPSSADPKLFKRANYRSRCRRLPTGPMQEK